MKRIAFLSIILAVSAFLIRIGVTAFAADVATTSAAPSTAPAEYEARRSGRYSNRRAMAVPSSAVASVASDHAPPMPREYLVLMTKSMFVRGHVAEAGHVGGRGSSATSSSANSAASTQESLARAETSLVFNGVTRTDTGIDALVEDTSTGHVLTVRSGDAVARGKVGKITMTTLDYIGSGGITTVQIGQNFTGNQADMSSVPTPTPSGSTGASPQDILERLRQKRLQELGGK